MSEQPNHTSDPKYTFPIEMTGEVWDGAVLDFDPESVDLLDAVRGLLNHQGFPEYNGEVSRVDLEFAEPRSPLDIDRSEQLPRLEFRENGSATFRLATDYKWLMDQQVGADFGTVGLFINVFGIVSRLNHARDVNIARAAVFTQMVLAARSNPDNIDSSLPNPKRNKLIAAGVGALSVAAAMKFPDSIITILAVDTTMLDISLILRNRRIKHQNEHLSNLITTTLEAVGVFDRTIEFDWIESGGGPVVRSDKDT